MAREHAVRVDDVGAHARQRRRVDVQRDGGVGASVADTVDVGGGEVEGSPAAKLRSRDGPSIVRRSSRTRPPTTATAPEETSWSW